MVRDAFLRIAALAILLSPVASHAQVSNAPISFGAPTPFAAAIGMSPAYRQAILGAEIDRVRPQALVRDPSGLLLDVVRRNGGQAFLRVPSAPFLPAGPSGGAAISGLGASFAGPGYRLDTASPFPARAPIETWIAQLDQLKPL